MPPSQQYLAAPSYPQYLAAPSTPAAPLTPHAGTLRLPQPTAPPVYPLPWTSSPTSFSPGVSSSVGVPGAYALPSIDGNNGDIVTGTISVDSFVAYALFDSGASFSFVSESFVARAGLSVLKIG